MTPVPQPEYVSFEAYKDRANYVMSWRISIFLSLVFLALIFTFLPGGLNATLGYIAALLISSVGTIYLWVTKDYKPLYTIYAIAGSIIAQLSCWLVLNTPHYVDFIWVIVCSFIAFLGGKKKLGFTLLALNLIGLSCFIFFQYNNHIEILTPLTPLELTGTFTEILLSFFIITYLMYQFIHLQEIGDQEIKTVNDKVLLQNQIVRKQNDANLTLLKEIHHRVKNNLQIIVSLLRLQKNELKSSESRAQFQEAICRVMVMSSIHQKLYQQDSITQLDLPQYLRELIEDLKLIFANDYKVDIDIRSTYDDMNLKTTVPVGLLINELVSNSLKYAFKEKNSGKITIAIDKTADGFSLDYSDNGTWIPPTQSSGGFGLELITVFTEQLNGDRQFKTCENGTRYIFAFKSQD